MNWRVLLGALLAAAGVALLLWHAWRTAGAVLRVWRSARAWRPCLRAFSVRRPAYFVAVARSEAARSSR